MNARNNETAPKLIQAKQLLQAQQIEKAKTLLEEVVVVDSHNVDANYLLGQIYELDEEYEEASNCYSKMVELHPTVELKYKLAKSFENIDKYEKAYILMKEIYEQQPDYLDVCEQFAHISLVLKRSADAIEAFNKILETDKDNLVALSQLCEIYYDEGDKLNHYLIKAKLNYLDNMLSGAVDCLKRALNYAKEEDDLVNVLLNLGKVLSDKGNVNEAVEQYQFVLATQPDNEYAKNKLDELNKKIENSYSEYSESWIDKILSFFK